MEKNTTTIPLILLALGLSSSVLAQDAIPDFDGNWWRTPAWDSNVTGVVALTPRALSEHGAALMNVFDPADDPSVRCDHPGAMRIILGPYPMSVEILEDRVLMRYELWDEVRTIHLQDQDTDPDEPHLDMGVSTGRFANDRLLVETQSLARGLNMTNGFLWTSEEASISEEYYLEGDESYLNVKLTLTDPVMLAEPWVVEKQWGRYDGELLDFDCIDRERP